MHYVTVIVMSYFYKMVDSYSYICIRIALHYATYLNFMFRFLQCIVILDFDPDLNILSFLTKAKEQRPKRQLNKQPLFFPNKIWTFLPYKHTVQLR